VLGQQQQELQQQLTWIWQPWDLKARWIGNQRAQIVGVSSFNQWKSILKQPRRKQCWTHTHTQIQFFSFNLTVIHHPPPTTQSPPEVPPAEAAAQNLQVRCHVPCNWSPETNPADTVAFRTALWENSREVLKRCVCNVSLSLSLFLSQD